MRVRVRVRHLGVAHDRGGDHERVGDLVLAVDAARNVVEDVVRGELHDVGEPLLELVALLAPPDAVEEEGGEVLERELVHLVDVALGWERVTVTGRGRARARGRERGLGVGGLCGSLACLPISFVG